MAEWKKVVVSGSSAALKEITNDPAVATATHLTNTRLTGSFSGSFTGNGAGLTGVTGEIDIDALAAGTTIVGADKIVYSDSGTEKSLTYAILSGSIYSGVSGDISIGEGGASAIGSDKITLAMLKRATTGSILNTIAGDVDVSTGGVSSIGSDKITLAMVKDATTGSILATLSGDITSTTAGVATIANDAVDGNKLADSITIADSLTVTNNATINGDLTVAGTASFNHSTNLSVADKYILLNSGSTSAGDGGIVIQQADGGIGELFGFDSFSNRFGITGSFDADTSANFVPDAFMSMVVSGSSGQNDPNVAPTRYKQAGNIFAAANGDIYIYST